MMEQGFIYEGGGGGGGQSRGLFLAGCGTVTELKENKHLLSATMTL